MAEFTSEPLVWEAHDMRLTIERIDGECGFEFLREHTDEEVAIAVLVPQKMADRNKFIPLNEAGFQWVASEIRLALSEARVAELEAEVQKEKDNAGAGESERSRLRKYNAEYRDRVTELQAERLPHSMETAPKDAWVNCVAKARWNGEGWESVGLMLGWVDRFDGDMPDCVADAVTAAADSPDRKDGESP